MQAERKLKLCTLCIEEFVFYLFFIFLNLIIERLFIVVNILCDKKQKKNTKF